MNNHIDLADEAELAFIQASTSIDSVEDEERMKQLLGEYLNVLKRLKPVREARITHIKMGRVRWN